MFLHLIMAKTTLIFLGWLLGATLACAVPLPASITPNLIVNGSFEDGPEVKDFLPLNPGVTSIRGWTVTRGQIDYICLTWQAAEGKRSLDLHGSPGFGGVAQTFATRSGRSYRVTFQASRSPGIVGDFGVIVDAAGQRDTFTIPHQGATKDNMQWSRHHFEFTANSAKTTLELRTIGTGNPFAGPALDDVTVMER